jgi:putative MATE family efflux protein
MEQENRLINEPIPLLIRQLAIPVSVGFFFNTMYNIVDTWYAKYLSTEGLAALTLSFPFFFLIIALSSGLGTGTTALMSHALGAGNKPKANLLFVQAISYVSILSIVVVTAGLLGLKPLIGKLTADALVADYAFQYLRVIFLGTPLFLLQSILNGALNSRGDTKSYRNILIVGFVLNLLLDPLLLFGVPSLHIPAMGAAGIALATVLIQFVGLFYLLYKTLRANCFDGVKISDFIPQLEQVGDITKQGIPASISMMTMALGVLVINVYLNIFGSTDALAAYGVAMRVEQIALLPAIGLNVAIVTLVSHNFGANRWERIHESYRVSLKYGFYIIAVMLPLVIIFANPLLRLFIKDEAVVTIGRTYLYIEVVTFYAYILLMNSTALLQGLKQPLFAIWIGIYRQLIAPIIVFYLFAETFGMGVTGIWWGISFVTWSGALITFVYARRILKKVSS